MIDVQKSIASGRIHLGENWIEITAEIVLWIGFGSILVIAPALALFFDLAHSKPISWRFVAFVSGNLLIGAMLVYWRTQIGTLICVRGKNRSQNLDAVAELSTELGWTLQRKSPRHCLIMQPRSRSSWGTTLYVFFDQNDLWLTVLAFGRGRIKSPIHYLDNRKMERTVSKRLVELLEAKTHPSLRQPSPH